MVHRCLLHFLEEVQRTLPLMALFTARNDRLFSAKECGDLWICRLKKSRRILYRSTGFPIVKSIGTGNVPTNCVTEDVFQHYQRWNRLETAAVGGETLGTPLRQCD